MFTDLFLDKLKERRSELRLSNQKISELSGIPLPTINSIFAGQVKNPTIFTIGPICAVLGISLDAFWGIKNESMAEEEIQRIQEEYKQHKTALKQIVEEHSYRLAHKEDEIQHNQEIIQRQDLRMEALNDRVEYQKKAITWLRFLAGVLGGYAILITVAIILIAA